jgi:HlyD family secretion protein
MAAASSNRKSRWKRWLWIAIVVAAVVALWAWAATRPVPVDTAKIARGPIRRTVEEEGRTRVVERYVVSASVAGRLLRVGLEEGDAVEPGQLLAEIDPLPLESRVEETEAGVRALRSRIAGVRTKKPKPEEIQRARLLEKTATEAVEEAEREVKRLEADHARLEKDLERSTALARDRRIDAAALDAARSAETQAREAVRAQEVRVRIRRLAVSVAELNRSILEARLHDYDWEEKEYGERIGGLEASLKALKDDLARARILAPARGVVLKLYQESEQTVAAGTPVVEVGDLNVLEVEADFLSEDVAHMRPGMGAEVFGRALGDVVLPAKVKRIHPSAFKKISSLGVEQQRVRVILAFDAEGSGLGDLYRVEVRVILDERDDALLVPEGALFQVDDRWHAFVVADGRAHLRAVETGLRDRRFREVLGGLEQGDVVVLHPEDAVADGARVKPLPSGRSR